jgi:hypothetical protein
VLFKKPSVSELPRQLIKNTKSEILRVGSRNFSREGLMKLDAENQCEKVEEAGIWDDKARCSVISGVSIQSQSKCSSRRIFFVLVFFFFETGYIHIPRLSWNLGSSCLYLPSAGITNGCYCLAYLGGFLVI